MASQLTYPKPLRPRTRRRRRLRRRVRSVLISCSLVALLWSGWTLIEWHFGQDSQLSANRSADQKPGKPDSPFHEAQALLTASGSLSKDDQQRALSLLKTTVSKEPSHTQAQAMLAELLVRIGQTKEALKQLHAAVQHSEDLRMVLATLYQSTGQPLAAREHAQLVIERYRPLAVTDLTQTEARLQWAQAELLLGNLEGVETILARGRAEIEDPRYDDLYLELQLAIAANSQDVNERVNALERILKLDPQHHRAINQLGKLLSEAKGQSEPRIVALLTHVETTPNPSLQVYQVLSGYHCHQESWNQAITLCERGLRHYPNAHSLKNNYAWAIAHHDANALPRALELATDAIDTAGSHPLRFEYLATRGTLYGLSSQWKESIADLEKVLNRLPSRPNLKAQLANGYTRVGRPELAESLLSSAQPSGN